MSDVRLETITHENVDKLGFFCQKSKRKTEGYQRKLAWLKQRLDEGMGMHILYEGKRSVGFIEYIPGAYSWRAVSAPDLMLIHCFWVVGKAKGKGYGSRLLARCEQETRGRGLAGVAVLTTGRVWLADNQIFARHGYQQVATSDPFELWQKRFKEGPAPTFPTDWRARAATFGPGLTVLRSDQCPYIDDAVNHVRAGAAATGIPFKVFQFETAQQARDLSPSPYGAFGIVHDGQLLAYHYLLPKDLNKILEKSAQMS